MGSWISILSPNPRWIADYAVGSQAAWSIALYDRSDSWGGSLYPTGIGDIVWDVEQAEQTDLNGSAKHNRELAALETRSSTLRDSVSARESGIQTISTGVSPRSVSNGNVLRADNEAASIRHTPGTECSVSRQSSILCGGPLLSLDTAGGSLLDPGTAPPHEDSDHESYQTLDSAWFDGVDPPDPHLLRSPRSSHESLTLNRRRRLGRPRRAPKAKLPLPRMSRKKRRREYRRRSASLNVSPTRLGPPAIRWLQRSFRAKDAPPPPQPSTPSTPAALGAYRPNPMFGNRACSGTYPRWDAVCNVAVPPRASKPWCRKMASVIFKARSLGSPRTALVIGCRTAGEPNGCCEMERVADDTRVSASSR